MSTRKKLIIAIIAMSIILVAILSALVVVLVENEQKAYSSVNIEYTSDSITATASANFIIDGTRTPFTNLGVSTVNFVAENTTSGTLYTDGYTNSTRQLDSTQNQLVFEFIFQNTARDVNMRIALNTLPSTTNYSIKYLLSTTQMTNFPLSSSITTYSTTTLNAGARLYIYVIADVTDITEDATLSGNFVWNLSRV